MKRSVLILSVLLLTQVGLFAQTGTLKGEITRDDDGLKEGVPFAKVWALESDRGKLCDVMGKFQMELPTGKHSIAIQTTGLNLKNDTIEINIVEGLIYELNLELKSKESEVIIVTAKRKTNEVSDIAIMREAMEDDKVTTTVSSKSIEESGESNLGSGAKKMTGMSTVGDVLYVRGLGDRYNVAYLNGLPIPSPNPDFRVVPLSIFPTDVIRSVSVSKVMSSELYGDFSGGAFNMVTKSFLENPTLSISFGTGGNSQTTFQDFKTYKGGRTDYFGIDDGTRAIPDFVFENSTPVSYSAINTIYPNSFYNSVEGRSTGFIDNFGTKLSNALPNTSFSVTGGNFYNFSDSESGSSGFGFMTLLSHDHAYRSSIGSIKLINAQSEERLNYDIFKYNKTTSTTGLLSLYLRVNPDHNITFNTLFVNTSDDETRDTWGQHFDYARDIYSNRITYKQNYISTNQILGSHKFLKPDEKNDFSKLILDWRASYSLTGSQEPDRRQIVMFYDDIDATENYAINYIDKNENHRFFSQLNETEAAGKMNIKYVARHEMVRENNADKANELITINAGVDYKSKQRDFDYKQYNYILNTLAQQVGNNVDINNMDSYLNSNQHDSGQFYIQEVANFGSSYRAILDVIGGYVDAKFKVNDLEIIPGVRYEFSNQSVVNRNQQTPSIIEKTINNSGVFLPSFITKYTKSYEDSYKKDVFRFAASKTVTRPKFNELAPFQYTLFFAGMKAEGNPELRNSSNYNFDFRYERYPKPGEMITIGTFYKYLDSPIEQTMKATASGQLMSFANALSAQVAGVELEYVRDLSFLTRDSSMQETLKDFTLGFNTTYMYTTVNIDTTDLSTINTNAVRPLEGASPFLMNVNLRYKKKLNDNEDELMVALAYNVFGKRLVTVGSNGIGDSYARSVNTLNFVSRYKFENNLSIGFKVKNILNPAVNIIQEDKVNVGEFINVSSIKSGIDVSLSVGYTIDYSRKKDEPKKNL